MLGHCKCSLRCSFIELPLLFQLLLVSLEVLHHEIFPGQLKVVPEMVDPLMRLQVEVVQYFVDSVPLDPEDVPVLTVTKAFEFLSSEN